MPANYREVLPHRSMAEKLLHECISIRLSFRKEQNPRRETIDAMYDKGALSLQCKFCGKQRQSDQRFRLSAERITCKAIRTSIGEMSNPPNGGIIRRAGASTSSANM